MNIWIVKWTGTLLCLLGILLTSFNVYPMNIFLGLVGSALWTYAGIYQRDMALFLVEAVAVLFYLLGSMSWIAKFLV